jgi:hypothetical protein
VEIEKFDPSLANYKVDGMTVEELPYSRFSHGRGQQAIRNPSGVDALSPTSMRADPDLKLLRMQLFTSVYSS